MVVGVEGGQQKLRGYSMHREMQRTPDTEYWILDTLAGRNTFRTCFGETGLKIRPDVFRHDDCEQKKHILLCKMSPASHFFLFEKGKKII